MTSRAAFESEPPRERPDSPPKSYGVPRRGGTYVEWGHVIERLTSAEAYWIATVTPRGRPHVVPIWGVMLNDDLYLETGAPITRKNRNLAGNPNVLVHLDGVNDAIIVRGLAEPMKPEGPLEDALIVAFHAKYPGYEPQPGGWAEGGLVLVQPSSVLAWGEMPTATRWRWPAAAPVSAPTDAAR